MDKAREKFEFMIELKNTEVNYEKGMQFVHGIYESAKDDENFFVIRLCDCDQRDFISFLSLWELSTCNYQAKHYAIQENVSHGGRWRTNGLGSIPAE